MPVWVNTVTCPYCLMTRFVQRKEWPFVGAKVGSRESDTALGKHHPTPPLLPVLVEGAMASPQVGAWVTTQEAKKQNGIPQGPRATVGEEGAFTSVD